jgi:hypothetical protein
MTKITLCGALVAAFPLLGQDVGLQQKIDLDKMIAETKALAFVGGQMISGKTIKRSPYSAQAVTETTQTLADGNRISRTTSSMIYRDSEGRERREESFGNGQSKAVFITDPVEGVSYTLEPNSKTARKNKTMERLSVVVRDGELAPPPPPPPPAAAARSNVVRSDQTVMTYSTSGTGGEGNSFFFTSSSSERQNAKTEDLGTQIIEGVAAQGTRTTVTIPAGQIGNEQPISIVSERWVSPDLGVAVMTSHSDPRSGKTTYKLTNISRSEPARTLFEVPPDYTVRGGIGEGLRVVHPEEQQ